MAEVVRKARGDLGVAAWCLRAFMRGEDSDEADAGAVLLAEGLAALSGRVHGG